jgi:transcriptional regulator with XRE-family HTH domain
MTLGERIRRRRLELGMTQQQLATEASLAQSLIASLESGKRFEVRSRALRRLARALRCSADDLIGTFEDEGHMVRSPVPATVGA